MLMQNTLSHFFFFSSRRRHTRFSRDWSSDVCSSDLHQLRRAAAARRRNATQLVSGGDTALEALVLDDSDIAAQYLARMLRSEERRVGKECRSRWAAEHQKKNVIKRSKGDSRAAVCTS